MMIHPSRIVCSIAVLVALTLMACRPTLPGAAPQEAPAAASAQAVGDSEELAALALQEVGALISGTHYYVSPNGNDDNDGLSTDAPFETILRAIVHAQAGDAIHLAPGEYRETLMTLRDGTPDAPITIIGPPQAVIRGSALDNVLVRINNDYHSLYGFTVDGLYGDGDKLRGYKDKLLYAIKHEPHNGIKGLRLLNMNFNNSGGECVRLRYFVEDSEIAYSRFTNCGIWDFVFDEGGKVGEAIYIGTSSKQWGDGKNATDGPDETRNNWIHHNFMDTRGNECVEAKEGATANIIEYNECTGQQDPDSAGIASRGSGNIIRHNKIYGNVGAGIRVGGHTVDGVEYGQDNEIYGNELFANQAGSLKIVVSNQRRICGNVLDDGSVTASAGDSIDAYDPAASCQ